MSIFYFKVILILLSLLYCNKLYSVNIFSWWGYLDKNIITKLESQCNTKVYFDEYYSTDEFLRRFYKDNYSIVIFSSVVYDFIKDRLNNSGMSLVKNKTKYNNEILNLFNIQKFSNNVGIFAISSAGILYNPDNIIIKKGDDLKTIFSKANNKMISIIDDPIEALMLINDLENKHDSDNQINEFKNLVSGTYPIITNDITKLVYDKNFAFAYVWMGEAYSRIIESKNKLKFILHPKTSYYSVDLIASIKKDSDTECVVKALSSKEILDPLLAKHYYQSPYGKNINIKFENREQNENFKLKWVSRPSKDEYQKKSNLWQRIKIAIKK